MRELVLPDIEGWMSNLELQWLFTQSARMTTVAEIGSWKGRSTSALLQGCLGTVYAVDHWQGSETELHEAHKEATERDVYADFKVNVGHYANLVVVKVISPEAARQFVDLSLDMVFIDGDHRKFKVVDDIIAWLPKCRKLLCGHDKDMCGAVGIGREMGLPIVSSGADSIWMVDVEIWRNSKTQRG